MSISDIIRSELHVTVGDRCPHVCGSNTREDLCQLFAKLGYKIGAEIGVLRGLMSECICLSNPTVHLICVDPWSTSYSRRANGYYQRTQNRLAKYDVEFKRITSAEAAPTVPDRSLDFVYIDALHDYDNVALDLRLWSQKVRVGGIVSGHDYVEGMPGVIRAVQEHVSINNVVDWYVMPEPGRSFLFAIG